MRVQIILPDDLALRIDALSTDCDAFVTEAVRRLLHESSQDTAADVRRISDVADKLNPEAQDVLEYQVIS